MGTQLQLYRKRIIPNEIVHLKNDTILVNNADLIITSWNALKQREDISTGVSAYFINESFKISKIFNHSGSLVYWYCDIIDTTYDESNNSYIFTDLLADVLIYPDETIKVLDLNEVGEALLSNAISKETASRALQLTDRLLTIIYNGEFSKYKTIVDNAIKKYLLT